MESQTVGWVCIGKERVKYNTVRLYTKTKQLQEEWGSLLGTGMEQLPEDTGRHSTNRAAYPVNSQETQSDKKQTTEQWK